VPAPAIRWGRVLDGKGADLFELFALSEPGANFPRGERKARLLKEFGKAGTLFELFALFEQGSRRGLASWVRFCSGPWFLHEAVRDDPPDAITGFAVVSKVVRSELSALTPVRIRSEAPAPEENRPWRGGALLLWAFLAMLLGVLGAKLETASASGTELPQK
jgi:hypothetical protein